MESSPRPMATEMQEEAPVPIILPSADKSVVIGMQRESPVTL